MGTNVEFDGVYVLTDDIVAREIEGELIIVPLVSGIGNLDDELFTLNETGRAIWDRFDGQKSLKDIVDELSTEFEDPAGEIEKDVIGLVGELLKRRIVIKVK
jgi:Coenzyme PQQ synthesis protein D (PqqD)